MPKRAGTYLEESVAVLFKKAGFKVKLNNRIRGYEIDVLAYKGNYKIAIECKQYERSHLTIRNILHQWASKGTRINVDKIAVVIAGQEPKKEDYRLAKELGIYLIDDEKIHYLNSLDKVELKEKLNDIIQFDKQKYIKKQKKRFIRNSIIVLSTIAFFYILIRFVNVPKEVWVVFGVLGFCFFIILLREIERKGGGR